MTLIEMLVTVAVLVIIMTVLVQIFQAATGAVTGAQAYQKLDDQFRRIDGIIRRDLEGTTATFTPAGADPNDFRQRNGYFEYGENEFADNQGEDCDDYIRFTAKAQPGQPFTGRMWVNPWSYTYTNAAGNQVTQLFQANGTNAANFPVTVTSDYAEIIYFLRNGNLYRRVLLVAPELQSAIAPAIANAGFNPLAYAPYSLAVTNPYAFQPFMFGGTPNGPAVSWQGVNDLSAHPSPTGPNANVAASSTALAQAQGTIVLNALPDLANRENRVFYSRYANDFWDVNKGTAQPDGIPDDNNSDNIWDLYPTLYPNIVNNWLNNNWSNTAPQLIYSPLTFVSGAGTTASPQPSTAAISLLGFPYIFPGAFSMAQARGNTTADYGWIHAPAPVANTLGGQLVPFDTGGLAYLNGLNHNPLDLGDNLPTPTNPPIQNGSESAMLQTWWGFPTWRETLSPHWTDPTVQVNLGSTILNGTTVTTYQPAGPSQPLGLNPLGYTATGWTTTEILSNNPFLPNGMAGGGAIANSNAVRALLPAMTAVWRQSPQLFTDGYGNNNIFFLPATTAFPGLWAQAWEDDLIMTNVRSFDVKAYDPTLGNFADLGWGDDLRLYVPYYNANPNVALVNPATTKPTSLFLSGTPLSFAWPPTNTSTRFYNPITQTFAHEGRMPPFISDNRLDAQNPNINYVNPTTFIPQYLSFPGYSSNVGDNTAGVVRLRRVWDSWSFEYSRVPPGGPGSAASGGFPQGPAGGNPPVYPSYPPPYPAPLQGIQIQIRVTDPTNQRIKSLTIRQDFTDKL